MRRNITASLAVLVLVVSVLGSGSQPAIAKPDPREERERVRQEQADVAAQVDALNADQATIERALADLAANVQANQQALATAEVELSEAEKRADDAADRVTAAEQEVDALQLELRAAIVDAYIAPRGRPADFLLGSGSLAEAAERRALSELQATDTSDVIDQVRAARAELDARRHTADEAAAEAESRRNDAARQLEEVQAAEKQQQEFAELVQARLELSTARAIELAETDKQLSTQIALEDAAIAARLREAELARQRERERIERQRLEEAQEAQEREEAAQQDAQDSAPPPAPDPPEPDTSPVPGGTSGGIPLCSAGGITVNCQIADSVGQMVSAARADGVSLSGGGYRDPAQQIALRRAHCGTSYYAIYLMPASQCSPPTAPPGTSMHEVGLAIDFHNCSSRSTACYRWLDANASRFGFYNLPSEPWHWSINGG